MRIRDIHMISGSITFVMLVFFLCGSLCGCASAAAAAGCIQTRGTMCCGTCAGPWTVRAEGEVIACAATREEAERIVFGLRLRYGSTVQAQLGAETKEKLTIERAPLKAYRQSEVQDVTDAVEAVARRNGSKDPPVTVVTKREVTEEKKIARPVKIIRRRGLSGDEVRIRDSGRDGTEARVSEVTLENGEYKEDRVIESRVTEEAEQAVVYEGSDLSAEEKGELVIDYAVRFLGTKYVWGGNDLREGIDCSGFTKAVYAAFGEELPRHSSDQARAGEAVSLGDARAGDIVCYSGHVALYIGEGRIIHATPGMIQFGEDAAYRPVVSVRRIFRDGSGEAGPDGDALIKLITAAAPNSSNAAEKAAEERDLEREERMRRREEERDEKLRRLLGAEDSSEAGGMKK